MPNVARNSLPLNDFYVAGKHAVARRDGANFRPPSSGRVDIVTTANARLM
jgi:hypothetical protein